MFKRKYGCVSMKTYQGGKKIVKNNNEKNNNNSEARQLKIKNPKLQSSTFCNLF